MSDPEKLPTYKIAILGARGVGKTSMVSQFVNNTFAEFCDPTIDDIRPYIKLIDLEKSGRKPKYCILKIVDLFAINDPDLTENGDDKKKETLINIIQNTKPVKKDKDKDDMSNKNILYLDKDLYGYVFVYDCSNTQTLKDVRDFIEYIWKDEKQENKHIKTKKILVGNKSDLLNKADQGKGDRHKNTSRIALIKEICETYELKPFECSALENNNITLVFEEIAKEIYSDETYEIYEKNQEALDVKKVKTTAIDAKKKTKTKKSDSGMCGGRTKVEDDDDDDSGKVYDENVKNLPTYGKQENGCTTF